MNLLPDLDEGTIRFRSDPLEQDLHLAGIPLFEVEIESDRAGGQVIAELHLLRENGESQLVTQGGLNLHHPEGPTSSPEPNLPLERIQATVELYPTDFILEEGAELQLTLRTQDTSLWYNPDPHLAHLTALLGQNTALVLPLVERSDEDVFRVSCGVHLDGWADCHDEDLRDIR